jgi:4-hydroxy-2-oxoheptanedioate aldolase
MTFVARLRSRERLIGYWVTTDNPVATERLARLGYDYIGIDGQHGMLDQRGWLAAVTAVDAAGNSAMVRVPANDAAQIGRALDIGARCVLVPLVNSAAEAAAAVTACRYPPDGIRSFGPTRSNLRIGPDPADANKEVSCVVMIETVAALKSVAEICRVPGLDAVYIGPSDMTISLGGRTSTDPDKAAALQEACDTVTATARDAGIACGIHCPDGATAARRLAAGFTFATVSSDLAHLERAAADHLSAAQQP